MNLKCFSDFTVCSMRQSQTIQFRPLEKALVRDRGATAIRQGKKKKKKEFARTIFIVLFFSSTNKLIYKMLENYLCHLFYLYFSLFVCPFCF